MSFGLRIRDASNVLRVDLADKVGRIVRREVLAAGTTGSLSVPGFSAANSVLFTARLGGVAVGAINENIGAHLAEWASPGTVDYWPSTSGAADFAPSLLLVIAFGDT